MMAHSLAETLDVVAWVQTNLPAQMVTFMTITEGRDLGGM
jgi:hypothetical protein